jgi:lipopolysaccharide export system protein LptA
MTDTKELTMKQGLSQLFYLLPTMRAIFAAMLAAPLTALTVLMTFTIHAPDAQAEKADRKKEIEIDAARQRADLANNVLILEGGVSLVQGTMRITAERMVVKRDDQQYIFAELFGSAANQVTFKEKREGFNDFMEGVADRAEFDDRANTIKLFTRARLKNGSDTLTGEYIYYNSESETIQADGSAPAAKPGQPTGAATTTGNGRVRIVIQPRAEAPAKADSKLQDKK